MTTGQSGGSVRRRPRRSEGRWQLRLAPGAASEDERGEDGSKTGNGGGLVGLTVGGGAGGTATATVRNALVTAAILASEADGLSQGWTGKAATWLSTGAKKRSGEESRMAAGAFECSRAWSGEGKRRGGWLGAVWGQERSGEGAAGVRRHVSRHGTSAVALGHSDSGGRPANMGGGGRVQRGCSG
jgi:hypothetical protein